MTATMGNETALATRWRRQWGDQGGLTLGVVQWDNPDKDEHNTAADLEIVKMGKRWGWDTVYDHTEDKQSGTGRRWDVDAMYRDETTFASLGWQEITAGFIPRIGFAPQVGFKGVNGFVEHKRQFAKGPWTEVQLESFLQDSRNQDEDKPYLRSAWMQLNGTTRRSLRISTEYSYQNYLGDESRFGTLGLRFPENDPYHTYGVSYTSGSVGSTPYSSVGATAGYRFKNKLTFSPALQFERFGSKTNEQHILGLSYEIDQHRSVSGRAVFQNGDINWYMAFRKSGNLGAEYFLILGDPNAQTFQKRIILKAVFPVNWSR
jgi:hypothetical protein